MPKNESLNNPNNQPLHTPFVTAAKTTAHDNPQERMRVFYVTTELAPFLTISEAAENARNLAITMQEQSMDVRIFMPRFGLIGERKNRLHEVVRLSGLNISMDDQEKPLIIKVASIPNSRMQVYFIDNNDYFQRKAVFGDKREAFFADNHERAIFFCKGALATLRRLGWAPDIIHCNDWMTSLIPLYVKTTYRNDPTFCNAKCVFALHKKPDINHPFSNNNLQALVKMPNIDNNMLSALKTNDLNAFLAIAEQYADTTIHPNNQPQTHDDYISLYQKLAQ